MTPHFMGAFLMISLGSAVSLLGFAAMGWRIETALTQQQATRVDVKATTEVQL